MLKRMFFVIALLALASFAFAQNNALQLGSAAPSPDYVQIGANQYNPIFNGLSGFTWEGWIRPSNVGTVSRVFHVGIIDPGTTAFGMEINANGSLTGYARSRSTDTAQSASSSAGTLSNNTWYYVAVSVNFASGQQRIAVYVNGTQVAVNNSPTFGSTTYLQGAAPTHVDLFGSYLPATDPRGYQGLMDEFRYWNYAKTQAQIKADMYKKLTGSESGLIGLWSFDESSGTTADDVTTSNKNGTLINFPANPWTTGVSNLSPVPTTQASGINTNPVSSTSQTVVWDNGNGASRIVIMNTVNSFTDPVNGDDPVADNSWNGAGEQVIYNGNGSSVTVSGLDTNTAYWYRVYEYNGSGVYTIYQTATALDNPFQGDETLPAELSSFLAVPHNEMYITVQWITQSETDVQGYYIYRNNVNDMSTASLISPLIEAANTTTTTHYTYEDREVGEGVWYYWLQNVDYNGTHFFHGPVICELYNQPGENPTPEVPVVASLDPVFPNPFNPLANIPYLLTEQASVKIDIFNTKGQLMSSFDQGTQAPGNYRVTWDGRDMNGNVGSSGVYLVRMTAGNKVYSRKAILMK